MTLRRPKILRRYEGGQNDVCTDTAVLEKASANASLLANQPGPLQQHLFLVPMHTTPALGSHTITDANSKFTCAVLVFPPVAIMKKA